MLIVILFSNLSRILVILSYYVDPNNSAIIPVCEDGGADEPGGSDHGDGAAQGEGPAVGDRQRQVTQGYR